MVLHDSRDDLHAIIKKPDTAESGILYSSVKALLELLREENANTETCGNLEDNVDGTLHPNNRASPNHVRQFNQMLPEQKGSTGILSTEFAAPDYGPA